jgi:hypothetical protein
MGLGPHRCGRCTRPLRRFRLLWLLLALAWMGWLLRELIRLCRLANRDRSKPADGRVPPWAYRQPDPLIYSQQYLQAQGLAVTWDNPDIHVELASAPGIPVQAHALLPDTDYIVVARIWNGSTTGPAPGLPVRVSYLAFGVGTSRHDVGATKVDLPVKAATGCPAFARVPWHTPAAPGHYCLQVELLWDDDANPANNMGQSNTDVKPLNSPHATFTFPVRNERPDRTAVTLAVDSYAIPQLEACDDIPHERGRRSRLEQHRAEAWAVPAGWRVEVDPSQLVLAPGDQADVTVDITAPDGFVGRQAVNVHARSGGDLLGGVTLYLDGNG